MKGAMLFGHTNGIYLDDNRYQPFWERAEALNAPIYLHAFDPMVLPRTYMGCAELQARCGAGPPRPPPCAAPDLQRRVQASSQADADPRPYGRDIAPTCCGGWTAARRRLRLGGEPVNPAEVLRSNVVVTSAGVFADDPLLCAMKALGNDRVMFSVDYPFESMDDASKWLDHGTVSD